MQSKQTSTRRRRLVVLAAGFILLMAAFTLGTPAGKAWARQIWHFFAYQPSDTLPVPTSLLEGDALATWEARPTATQITLAGCGDWGKPLCTIAQVQERVDFPLQQFEALPPDVHFQGAYENKGVVLIRYFQGLDLVQGRSANFPLVLADVGASAQIEAVRIGPVQGEYVQGAWFVDPQGGQQTWQSGEGLQTLRWQSGEIGYTIRAYESRWSRADLEALANSLYIPASEPQQDLSHLSSLDDAEAIAGYPLQALDPLPQGYIFHFASVDLPSRSVCLHYMYTRNDGPGPYLRVAQGPVELAPDLALLSEEQDPKSALRQTVQVGGAQGAFWIAGLKRPGWACSDTVEGYAGAPSMTFTAQGKQFDLYAPLTGCVLPEGFTRLGAIRLAESLTGTPTHPADELDPECLRRAADAEALAGFHVKEPAWLPSGLAFSRASFFEVEGQPSVSLLIGVQNSDGTAFTINQAPLQAGQRSLADVVAGIPEGGFEKLDIHGTPAVLIRGDWVINANGEKEWYQPEHFAETLYWESDGLLITIGGPWFADDPGDSLATLVAIAEGLQ